jgi:hypothetical protein
MQDVCQPDTPTPRRSESDLSYQRASYWLGHADLRGSKWQRTDFYFPTPRSEHSGEHWPVQRASSSVGFGSNSSLMHSITVTSLLHHCYKKAEDAS